MFTKLAFSLVTCRGPEAETLGAQSTPPPPHLPQQQVLGPFELSSGRGRRHRHRRVYNRPGNGPMIMPCKSPWRCSGTDILLYELVTEAKREQVMDQCYSKAVVLSSGRFASQGTLSNDWRPFWPGVGGGLVFTAGI